MKEPGAVIKKWGWWALALLAFASAARAQETSVTQPLTGKTVISVRVIAEERGIAEENPSSLPLKTNQPYSVNAVRESIRALYRTGKYSEVEAYAFPESAGVRVEFRATENYFVDTVKVLGLKSAESESQALAALRLRIGEVFRESELEEGLIRLREVLQMLGYYQAEWKAQKIPHPSTRQLDVLVHVTPGPPAKIGAVDLKSATTLKNRDLLRRAKLKGGTELKPNTLDNATERLRKYLVKKGHLGARVFARRGDYDPQTNSLPITLEVYEGPTLAVKVEGAKISQSVLKRLVPVYQEGAMDADLLQEGRRNIRDYLETEGYFDSKVDYSTEEDAESGMLVVKYEVALGPRRRLAGIAFSGNKYFSSDLLLERLTARVATGVSRGRFSQRLLDGDVDSIRSLYASNGFANVQVKARVTEDFEGKEGNLFVNYEIEEGPQTRVAELKLTGNAELPSDYLLNYVGSTKGQPYSLFNVQGDRDNLLAIYFNEGFPEATFEFEAKNGPEPNRVELTYRITEGPQVHVKDVLYSGMEYTRLGTVRNQVLLKPGEPLRQGEVIESQRNLYNLGIFNRVQITPQNPNGTDTEKTLLVNVEEAKRYTIAYGGGFEIQRQGGNSSDPTGSAYRASPRGLFEISKLNVGGRGHTVSLRARASTFQYRFAASYLAPNFLARPSLRFEIGGFAEKESDVRTFTALKYEASAQLVHQVTPFTTMGYRYSFRKVLVDADSLKVDPAQIPLLSQPTKISSFGTAWIRDHRDNPAEARGGTFYSLDMSVAAEKIGATGNFARLFAQNSTFHPFRALTFARTTRFGVLQRFAGSLATDIPLPERIYGGGGNSLRGFGFNQAGPRATTGFPVGGEVMMIFNQELRFPMKLPFVKGRVGGGIFYDAGNVFNDTGNVTLRSKPRPQALGLGDFFSHTVGVSFRYSTPIGPVRLDFGYLLNNIQFNFQENSTSPVQAARLPRFQFFFNIGSMF